MPIFGIRYIMPRVAEIAPTNVRTFTGKNLPVSRLLYPQLQKDYLNLLFMQREEKGR